MIMTVLAHKDIAEYDVDGQAITWDYEICFISGLWDEGSPFPVVMYPCWTDEWVTDDDLEEEAKSGLLRGWGSCGGRLTHRAF